MESCAHESAVVVAFTLCNMILTFIKSRICMLITLKVITMNSLAIVHVASLI